PWQLCGYGRGDWSTKLIRGLISEAAAGFRSRLGPSHDSTLVTPHNAPFSTYKAALSSRIADKQSPDLAHRGRGISSAGDNLSVDLISRRPKLAPCHSTSSR